MVMVAVMVAALLAAPLVSQARWMNPNTGRFQTMDSYEGRASDPISLHKYLYCSGNVPNAIDPTGLITYLLVYGQDDSDLFKNAAKHREQEIKASSDFNPEADLVVVRPVYTVSRLITVLNVFQDIGYLAYFGHGGPGALYLGKPMGKDFNLSPNGGPCGGPGGASDSTPVSELPTDNVRWDAFIELIACDSSVSLPGETSMTRAFANHFGVPAYGAGAGVGFRKDGTPYIKYWRIGLAWIQNIIRQSGGGGWSTTRPEFSGPMIMPSFAF